MRLVIDRSKWLRGEGSDASRLLRPSDGHMCCLGFYSLACGLPEHAITDREALTDDGALPDEMRWLVQEAGRASICAIRLMMKNDDEHETDNEREDYVRNVFAQHGVEVVFVDGSAPSGGQTDG